MKRNADDELQYEGSLMYPLRDPNFQDSQFVIALNLGQETLVPRVVK
jgi:hypothetical protein